MKELVILRHAQTESIEMGGQDIHRPLTEQGRSDALRQSEWLREFHWIPDQVLASPAVRARQTAEIVCEHLGVDGRGIVDDQSLYEATTGDLLRILEEHDGERVLVVAHNPGLADLAGFLTGAYVRLGPGSAAWITFESAPEGHAQPGSGHLHRLRHAIDQ